MLNNPTRLLFFLTLMLGSLIAVSSTSWLGAWLGLEINLLSFIPLMSNSSNQFSTESALKYFLTQALASAILLVSVIFLGLTSNLDLGVSLENLNLMISSTLLLKMGAAPFHFWFPGVMEGLSWINGLILMTWQKIAPLMLISYTFSLNLFATMVILLSVLIGSLGGFNQTSLRKIMAYSSINHLGWMLSAMLLGEVYWVTYFCFYIFLSVSVVVLFNLYQLSHINQVFCSSSNNKIIKLGLFCNLLSLGGLPPFLGFLPKWLIIQGMVSNGLTFIISVMVLMTLITLYFYIRVGYSAFMLTHSETKWNYYQAFTPSSTLVNYVLTSISIGGLLLCASVFSIL
uniref:NADH-ubiquinone oxidoreductase chain 2 n=1 Tax=Siphlonurus sp. MT-2014 TaxID=1560021 RepID=A0A0A0RV32_9INSE|nr:NADH dehydrogenase subunit 2 [Siphlonurus sp. MT-2014]